MLELRKSRVGAAAFHIECGSSVYALAWCASANTLACGCDGESCVIDWPSVVAFVKGNGSPPLPRKLAPLPVSSRSAGFLPIVI